MSQISVAAIILIALVGTLIGLAIIRRRDQNPVPSILEDVAATRPAESAVEAAEQSRAALDYLSADFRG